MIAWQILKIWLDFWRHLVPAADEMLCNIKGCQAVLLLGDIGRKAMQICPSMGYKGTTMLCSEDDPTWCASHATATQCK